MKTLTWLALPVLAGSTLALSACQQDVAPASGVEAADSAIDTGADMAADTASPEAVLDAATYVAKAGAGDLFEIESSQAILKTTQNPQVKDFAQAMIAAHEESTKKIKAAAKAADLNVEAPRLTPEMRLKLTAIKALKGTDADTLYLGAQKQAHKDALALHQAYAAVGHTPQLKAVAIQIVPVVEHHIAMLGDIG